MTTRKLVKKAPPQPDPMDALRAEVAVFLDAKLQEAHFNGVRGDAQKVILDLMTEMAITTTTLEETGVGTVTVTAVRPEATPQIDHDATRTALEAAGVKDCYTKRVLTVWEPDEDKLADLANDRRTSKYIKTLPGKTISPSIRVTVHEPKPKKQARVRG